MRHAGPSEKVEVSKLVNGEPWGRERPRGLVHVGDIFVHIYSD